MNSTPWYTIDKAARKDAASKEDIKAMGRWDLQQPFQPLIATPCITKTHIAHQVLIIIQRKVTTTLPHHSITYNESYSKNNKNKKLLT